MQHHRKPLVTETILDWILTHDESLAASLVRDAETIAEWSEITAEEIKAYLNPRVKSLPSARR